MVVGRHLVDAEGLADRQLQLDRARTRRFPHLLARKLERMTASPLGFLRGSAPLFYEVLANDRDLASGADGEGWLVGDMHLENFGAYRPDPRGEARDERSAVFDLNDFDDAVVGPWRFDLLRLATSVLLAGRELGADGRLALDLVDRLLAAWTRASSGHTRLPPRPRPVKRLVAQVGGRSRSELVDARTSVVRGRRRFARGPRYADLPREVAASVPSALGAYVRALPATDAPSEGELEVVDVAHRIAGTGSLGGLRIAVLVRNERTGSLSIFDMKEQGAPSAAPLLRAPRRLPPAERVVAAFRACVARPPKMLGTTRLLGASMIVRKLTPQEDRLAYADLRDRDLPALAGYLGALLGAGHARGATRTAEWTASDLAHLRANAIRMAGLHEAVYLALCDRAREVVHRG